MSNEDGPEFCLRWNNHHQALISILESLLSKESLVDVILTAEGQSIKVHRIVLFACSQYFVDLLCQQSDKLAVVFLKDVSFTDLKSLVEYMYRGEICISQHQLESFLWTAEALQIRGLSDKPNQKVLLPKLPADTLISKEYIKPSCIQNHDLESQLKTPRPPRLTRPKSQKEMVHGEEFDVSNRAIADDVNLKQNLVIDHPVNQENRLDRESLKYDEEETCPEPLSQADVGTSVSTSFDTGSNVNRDSANESWTSENSANTPGELNCDHMSDSSQGAEGPVPELAIIEDPDGSDRPFMCPRCSRRYKRKNNAVAHLRYECGVVPSFPCPICSHMLSQRRYIQKHIRRKHPGYILDYQEYKEKKYSAPQEEDIDVKTLIST